MQRKLRCAALCVAVMLGAAGSTAAQEVLKIGGVGPLSGGGTAWGLAAQRGIDLTLATRGRRSAPLPAGVKTLTLDMADPIKKDKMAKSDMLAEDGSM